MSALRDWLGWAAAWVLVAQTPVWVGVALDAWRERTEPTLDPMPVASWVPDLSYAAGVAVPLGLVLVLLGLRSSASRRVGMLVGAVGLAVGSVAFTGFPDGEVGSWTVGLTALAAACALLTALIPPRDGPVEAPATLPGVALAGSGVFAAWTCWQGGSYWAWRGSSALIYQFGLGAAAVLVLLGLTASRWAAVGSRLLRWAFLVGGILGALWAFAGASYLVGDGVLYRWDEIESPWDYGVPLLLLGVGVAATAVAVWRRRGDLVGWSLAAATTFCLLSLWQQSTWGSVMR